VTTTTTTDIYITKKHQPEQNIPIVLEPEPPKILKNPKKFQSLASRPMNVPPIAVEDPPPI
jgi:hypothetical protein